MGRRLVHLVAFVVLGTYLLSLPAIAQQAPGTLVPGSLIVKALADKKVPTLPAGRPRLYWRLETFPTLAEAQAAAGPWGVAVEAAGKAWLFTLAPKGGSSKGGTKVAEVGPLHSVRASEYLLRINEGSGPPGSITAVHSHPGTEAFYVMTGELCIRTASGMIRITAGRAEAGPEVDAPVQISSCGTTNLYELIMFVVDANRPFSSPATLP